MNPVIIIGMDNTGKTTLVTEFEKQLKGYLGLINKIPFSSDFKETKTELIKSPGPLDRKDMHSWCYDQILKFGAPSDVIKIYDRFGCIDEQIYAPIVRNNPHIDHVQHLTDLMTKLPLEDTPFFIYARPSRGKILGFEDGREQMKGVIENGDKLVTAYDELFFQLRSKGFRVITYDYTKNDAIDVLGDYIRFVVENKDKLRVLPVGKVIEDLKTLELFTEAEIDHANQEVLRDMQLAIKNWVSTHQDLVKKLDMKKIRLDKECEDELLKKKLKAARQLITINDRLFKLL